MMPPTVAVVVHGARWPDPDRAAAVRDQMSRVTGQAVPVVIARDEESRPRGAAACINDAVAQTTAEVVVIVDATSVADDGTIAAMIGALGALAWIGPPDLLDPLWQDDVVDIPAALAEGAQSRAATARDDPAFWAVRREAWQAVGGLDSDLWSIGAVADLAARLRAHGDDPRGVAAPDAPTVAASYPLSPDVRGLLAWRNTLVTIARSAPDPQLGPLLSRALSALLAAAWHGTGLSTTEIAFGGGWGRASLRQRLRTRLGGRPADDLWPADERATAIPLAALQSFALALPGLLAQRRAALLLTPTPPAPPTTHGTAAAPSIDAPLTPPTARATPTPPTPPMPPTRARVSVIVVTWNGRQHLEACFASVLASDYPGDLLEVVCVDNGSIDGTAGFLAERFPDVRVVSLPENLGFTGGNAAGVAQAIGDVLVFLNNDMRVEPTLVSALVNALDGEMACAGARVMSWDGQRIDFVRGTSSFELRGFQEHYQQRFTPGMALADSFFPNGGAFAVTRTAYEQAGGFDPHLFAYYDDVDLGWRLRAAGFGIRTVPDAVAYHRHGATVRTQPAAHKRWLMTRNALWVALRTYDDAALPAVVPALLTLAGLRIAQDTRWLGTRDARRLRHWTSTSRRAIAPRDVYVTHPARAPEGGAEATPERTRRDRVLAALPMPELAAVGSVLSALPQLFRARAECQARRRRPDAEVLPHLGRPFEVLDGRASYAQAQRALVELLQLKTVVGQRPHVLLVTHEALRQNMSGPAVRVLEMGRALSRRVRVTIASPGPVEISDSRVAIVAYDPAAPAALRAQADSADVLVVQGFALHSYPFLTRLVAPVVVDLYCPFTLEYLEQTRRDGGQVDPDTAREARAILEVQNAQLQSGDFFLCASERQRDFWTGALHTAGRVNAHTLAGDADLRRLLAVVPFGLPAQPIQEHVARARARRAAEGRPTGALKGVHPAIGPHDKVLLWGGSLLDWQDPETLIEAVALLSKARDDIRLFFMGVRHPNPQVKPMAVVERAMALARARGLLDTHVIFNDWVPYDERALYLRDADIGVSTHRAHLETRYSFRTRMLDYLWATLPIVCTEGDFFGDLVQRRGLGLAVRPEDPAALASALSTMLDDQDARRTAYAALTDVARGMTWDAVTAPLADFCVSPTFAADRTRAVERFHEAMAGSFRATRLLKRTLLRLGVAEGDIESVKRWRSVQTAMTWRNKAALWRARRRAGAA